jgi:hypothetical protein
MESVMIKYDGTVRNQMFTINSLKPLNQLFERRCKFDLTQNEKI